MDPIDAEMREVLKIDLQRNLGALQVMELQQELNTQLKKAYLQRITWGGIKWKIPEFCQGLLQFEKFPKYKDLTLEQLLWTWGHICNLKPKELEKLVTMTGEKVACLEKQLSE